MAIMTILMGRSSYFEQNLSEQYPNANKFTFGDWIIWYEGEEPSEGEIYKFLAEGEDMGEGKE